MGCDAVTVSHCRCRQSLPVVGTSAHPCCNRSIHKAYYQYLVRPHLRFRLFKLWYVDRIQVPVRVLLANGLYRLLLQVTTTNNDEI